MSHDYEADVFINHDWCSFENGGQPSVRSGDLKGTKIKRISGNARWGDELFYQLTVGIEAV